MTEQEFDNLEWQFSSHLSTQDYHSTIDKCKTIPNLFRCTKVNYKDGEPSNRGGYTHYMLADKVYKSKQKLLEAITMSNKTYCGECDNFLYEDIDGYGICGKTNEECRCSDKCHLTNGKP